MANSAQLSLRVHYDPDQYENTELIKALEERLHALAEPGFSYGPERPARSVPTITVVNE